MAKAKTQEDPKVYVVVPLGVGDGLGGFHEQDDEVTRESFADHVDFDRLIQIGALKP